MAGKRRNEYDAVVVGGGLAGLTAGWQAVQHGLSLAVLEVGLFGGQVATVSAIEGFPGVEVMSGADLASVLMGAVREAGGDLVEAKAQSVERMGRQFRVSSGEDIWRTRALLVASGARLRSLDAEGAERMEGRGLSHCASCDGPLYRGQDVVVVGGGDSAVQEAAVLAGMCRSVTLVVRGRLRARRQYVRRLQSFGNVRIVWNSVVEAVLGDEGVTGVRLCEQDSGATSEIACTGLFPFIGLIPNTEFLGDLVERDETGALVTDANFDTSVPGIKAVGAVRRGFSGELASAVGEGASAMAMIAAVRQ